MGKISSIHSALVSSKISIASISRLNDQTDLLLRGICPFKWTSYLKIGLEQKITSFLYLLKNEKKTQNKEKITLNIFKKQTSLHIKKSI
jgi:hypothetical protein